MNKENKIKWGGWASKLTEEEISLRMSKNRKAGWDRLSVEEKKAKSAALHAAKRVKKFLRLAVKQ